MSRRAGTLYLLSEGQDCLDRRHSKQELQCQETHETIYDMCRAAWLLYDFQHLGGIQEA
jgi:hypothetical protein